MSDYVNAFRSLIVTWALACLAISATDMAHATEVELTKGLRLYLPFSGTAAPSFCTGSPEVALGAGFLGEGRVGQGISVIGSASVSVAAVGNFHRPRGTIAFWHRPAWKPDTSANAMLLRQSNFQVMWYCRNRVLFFMTGKTKLGLGYRWDYSVASDAPRSWRDGPWHHVAITWDAATGRKEIYIDGRLSDEGKTDWIRSDKTRLRDALVLGSESAQGQYDEWTVWGRVLSGGEIAFLAGSPEAAAKVLAAVKPEQAEVQAPVSFELTKIEPAKAVVNPGESFDLSTTAENHTKGPIDLVMRMSLLDAFDHVHELRNKRLVLNPSEKKPMTFPLKARANGCYKLRAEMDWEGETFRADLGGFAVWPEGKLRPSVDSFFGYHVNSWFGGRFVRQAQRLGLSWQRNHNMLQTTWWSRVQPQPGAARWTYDFQLDYWKKAGVSVLGEFFATPYWAADPPQPKTKNPGDYPRGSKPRLDEFEKYVRMVVARYKDYIHVWEVWNEPSVPMFWKGTPEEFGRLSEIACKAAKETDPTCTVIVGGFTGAYPREWYETVGKHGGFRRADGISYHGYAHKPKDMQRKHHLFRSIAEQFAPKGKTFELWDSEWGIHDTTFYVDGAFADLPPRRFLPKPSYLQGAAGVVKADCVAMALGVKRSFYYLHNPVKGASAYHNGSSMEITYALRPKMMARVALGSLVRGARVHALVEEEGLTATVFAKANGASMAVAWLPEGAKASADIPNAKGFDIFANLVKREEGQPIELSSVPVYIDAPFSVDRLAEHLRQVAKMVQR